MLDPKHLPNQRPDERVELFVQRHWFAVARIVMVFLLLLLVPTIAGIIFWNTLALWLAHAFFGPLMALLGSVYVLFVWLLVFVEYTDYYLDTWIVTNERIFNIEHHGLFHRVASELHLSQVEDVTAETRGILHTIFTYGDVHVQTAAERVRFHFKDVDNPEIVKQKILLLASEDRKRHSTPQVS